MSKVELKKCINKMLDEMDDYNALYKIFKFVHRLFL